MINKFGLKALAISIALVIIAGGVVMQDSADAEKGMKSHEQKWRKRRMSKEVMRNE